ncbi:hypothetical protein SETIT_3G242800v2 [Setaria italica]|uniref:Uncharacterized protein n=1 Tax=Setaria italica TaxID=4555 RepID=A0A368QIC1_SETIT|nr:hypothetical protein SETIT_3G242800v2 [Setaria italica]
MFLISKTTNQILIVQNLVPHSYIAKIQSHVMAEILKTILRVAIPNSGPHNLQSSPILDYAVVQPASATSSRSEVSLGGLQEAVELRQQVVE